MQWAQKQKGFTIVELLVVVVVIAILASIVIVGYNGLQVRARDAQRVTDVATIAKALEVYYLENGQYPGSPNQTGGSGTINGAWSTTADSSWQRLIDTLAPYVKGIGKDPISVPDRSVLGANTYNYAYFASATDYCGAAPYQMYILAYKLEGSEQKNTLQGECSTKSLIYAGISNYRVVR